MKKKILIFSDCFVYSGSEIVIENILLSELINKTYETCFVYAKTPLYHQRLQERLNTLGIEKNKVKPHFFISIDYYDYLNKLNRLKGLQKLALSFKLKLLILMRLSFISYFINLFLLIRVFKISNVDFIYINNGGYPGSLICRLAVLAARIIGIKKIVFNINNMPFKANRLSEKILDNFVRKGVDVFVTASYAAQRNMTLIRNFPTQKFIRIPNTISNDSSMIKKIKKNDVPSKYFIFGAIGLLTYRKGYHILIEAASILKNQYNFLNFQIQILGDGEEKDNLEKQVIDLKLSNEIKFLGFKSDPFNYLNNFDVFVLPSIQNEDFPYVVIEAMLCSKPVIGTKVAGIPEQIDQGKTGYLVNPSDPMELAIAMKDSMLNAEIKIFGENGFKKYFDEFSYQITMKKYYKVFQELTLNNL